uniref:Uncharacterized protein n=1 Tax=Oryza brachyantha TaxID=4533 RepID=J3LK06_ORYBR
MAKTAWPGTLVLVAGVLLCAAVEVAVGAKRVSISDDLRDVDEVFGIATRWTNVLRTGSVAAKFVAVDFGTLMFTMDRGQDIAELKEFILSQPEAYEFKIGDQVFRRPGDPPLDQVVEMLQKQKSQDSDSRPYKSRVEL